MIVFGSDRKTKRKICYVLFGLVVVIILDTVINGADSFIIQNVIDKIADIEYSNGSYNRETSGGARFFVIDKAIRAMGVNPLFGVGDKGYASLTAGTRWAHGGTGNILFTIIATRGLVSVSISLFLILYLAVINKKNKWTCVALILLYLNTCLGQSHIIDPVFVMIASIPGKNWKGICGSDRPYKRSIFKKASIMR